MDELLLEEMLPKISIVMLLHYLLILKGYFEFYLVECRIILLMLYRLVSKGFKPLRIHVLCRMYWYTSLIFGPFDLLHFQTLHLFTAWPARYDAFPKQWVIAPVSSCFAALSKTLKDCGWKIDILTSMVQRFSDLCPRLHRHLLSNHPMFTGP